MHLRLLPKAIRALRDGRLGDAGMLKAVALTAEPYPEALRAVRSLADPLPDLTKRLAVPMVEGSLGWAYGRFIAEHGIRPLAISPAVRDEVAPLNGVAARYVLVHDLFHVLLGFDISRPGELAVWSFVAEQRYSPSYGRACALARVLYPLAEPSAIAELGRQRRRAIALARQVPCLIGQPLEQYWSQPLAQVRETVGIPRMNCA